MNGQRQHGMAKALRGAALGLGLLWAFAAPAQESVLFEEDFGGAPVGQRPAGFSAKGIVREENGGRYLSCTNGYGFMLNPNLMRYLGGRKWGDLEWSFRFRLAGPKNNGFSLVLKSGGDRPAGLKYIWYYVTIGLDGMSAAPQGASAGDTARGSLKKVMYAENGLGLLKTGTWYKVQAVVKGDELAVSLENGGRMTPLLSGRVFPGGGGIDLLSYNALDVTDIRVVEIAAMKEKKP